MPCLDDLPTEEKYQDGNDRNDDQYGRRREIESVTVVNV